MRNSARASRVISDRELFILKRPPDTGLRQQTMKAWEPLLTPDWVIAILFLISLFAIPIGLVLLHFAEDAVTISARYDNIPGCAINSWCHFNITIPRNMNPNIAVYYELHNFYQNHRLYVKSKNNEQLNGDISKTAECSPIVQDSNNRIVVPCGLQPYSKFNDTFDPYICSGSQCERLLCPGGNQNALNQYCPNWNSFRISWDSDRWDRYTYKDSVNYSGPVYTDVYNGVKLSPSNNEDLIVWMRLAALPNFRKLYRRVTTRKFNAGDHLYIRVFNRFPVKQFEGEKHLVFATTNTFGGRNHFLALVYLITGAICIFASAVFQIIQVRHPRKLGDLSLFKWGITET